jgi:integrase/recombinase XerD
MARMAIEVGLLCGKPRDRARFVVPQDRRSRIAENRRPTARGSFDSLDQERGTLMVRQGKGKKDRMVPIGERAIAWLAHYLNDARPQLVLPPDPGTLFLTQEGEEISCHRLTQLVRGYVVAADMGKSGACHLFRHTCATLMLEGGADIRYIQEMLGHVELSTTQIYTQVSIRKLKAVHTLTHPGAKLERAAGAADEAETENGEPSANGSVPEVDAGADVLEPAGNGQDAAVSAPVPPNVAAEALFAALDAEAEEEATGGP